MDGRRLRIDQPHKSFERSLDDFERLLKAAASTAPLSFAFSKKSLEDNSYSNCEASCAPINELLNAELASLDAHRRRENLIREYR